MSEEQWQSYVVGFATQHGWEAAHCRKVLVKDGKDRTHWETTMPKGWFDLVLARDLPEYEDSSKVYYVELKTEDGVQTEEQKKWERLFTACGQTCFLWRPHNWPVIQKLLAYPKGYRTPK